MVLDPVYSGRHSGRPVHYRLVLTGLPGGVRLGLWQFFQVCLQGGVQDPGSQGPHLDDVNVRGIPRIRGHVQLTTAVAGDDEDDGGGAERHLLLGPVPLAAGPGRDDGPDGARDRSEGPFLEAALQPGEARAEQLQQAVPELVEVDTGQQPPFSPRLLGNINISIQSNWKKLLFLF